MGNCETLDYCNNEDTLYLDNIIEFDDEKIRISTCGSGEEVNTSKTPLYISKIVFNVPAPQSDALLYTVGLLFNSTTYEVMLNGAVMEQYIKNTISGLQFNEIYLLTIYFYEEVMKYD